MEGFNKRYDIIDYGVLSRIILYYRNTKAAIMHPLRRFHENTAYEYQYLERLGRAFSNVTDGDAPATYSRFAIWGAGLNTLLEQTAEAINRSDKQAAMHLLEVLQRNVRAYVDCCAMVDSQPGHMQFERPDQILDEYKKYMEETSENSDAEKVSIYDDICGMLKEFRRQKYKKLFRSY